MNFETHANIVAEVIVKRPNNEKEHMSFTSCPVYLM